MGIFVFFSRISTFLFIYLIFQIKGVVLHVSVYVTRPQYASVQGSSVPRCVLKSAGVRC